MLPSPIFYMGCKYKLLKTLIPLFPNECETFFDVFGGSAVVCMNYKGTKRTIYNDFNIDTVEFVKLFRDNTPEQLHEYFDSTIKEYGLVCLGNEFRDQMEKQKGYYAFRKHYNETSGKDIRDLYLLSCYSINHLIRFNQNKEFNASCGSTHKYIYDKVKDAYPLLQGIEIQNNNIFDIDFDFLTSKDFVYFDPPYCQTHAVYNESREFGGWSIDDDYKLFQILEDLDSRGIKWGLSNVVVNRGKVNEHLAEWYRKCNWNVYHLNRNYQPFTSGKSNTDEVFICNYQKEE